MLRAVPRLLFFLAATLVLNFSASPQDRLLTPDDLYDPEKRVNFGGNPPPGLTWLDDHHYLQGARKVNALMQNSIQFIYELQKAGKQFEFMTCPKSRHAVTDPRLVRHMREMTLKFIVENL